MTNNIKLPGVGELFTRTWELYSQRFWTFVAIGVLPAIAILVLSSLGSALKAGTNPVLNLLGIIVLITITLWMSAALMIAILGAEDRVGASDAYKKSWPYLFKYFLLGFVWTVLISVGYVLFVIPGIYLMIALIFPFVILLAEKDPQGKVSVIFSIKQSWFYVKGYWWAVFGRFLFLMLILLGFMILLGLVVLLPVTLLSFISPGIGGFFQSLGGSAVNILLTPFADIYWILMYKALKQIKQS